MIVEGVETTALLDTGSCVSTITEDFYHNHLGYLTLHNLEEILEIECASGDHLKYLGFVEAKMKVAGIDEDDNQTCLFLVVPESRYGKTVPVLLGTNILSCLMKSCKDKFGERYLQKAELHTPWYLSFRCMHIRETTLKRTKNRLGIVRSAERKTILIHPNTEISIEGYVSQDIEYKPCTAILEETEDSVITKDLDITPAVINYKYKDNGIINVKISNVTNKIVAVAPNAVLGELQKAEVEPLCNRISAQNKADADDLFDKITIESKNLTATQIEQVKDLVREYEDVFSKADDDIGHYTGVSHKINLSDERPFKQRYRRIPPSMIDEVRAHLEELLEAGIIRESHSPFASNVVLVRKASGQLRLCVDYRMLNKRTIKDQYALPRIEEVLDCLAGAKYFSVVDMKSGYHQIEVEETHKERTAFTVGPLGFFEFNRLPFGLNNSPATYQRLMEQCLGDLNMKICIIYLDDLIIFSNSFEEHLERLETVFQRLRKCNLKLASKKCFFLQPRVKYVGFIVSEDGIATDPVKVEKVKNWPKPTCAEEVRQFVAFAGYYRRFIRNFSKVVRPLNEVMPPQSQRKGSKTKNKEGFTWGREQQQAFETLKELMTSAPVLAYANFNEQFELHIDASQQGLGAVLCQKQEGLTRVISFASRALSKSEKNYPTMKLEFLALKWAICEKFNDYLYGNKFTVLTDNNPLTYALTTAKLDATGQRWISALATFDFDINYKPGRSNIDADSLSRYPKRDQQDTEETVTESAVKAICNVNQCHPLVEAVATPELDIIEATECPGSPMAQVEMRELRRRQREDDVIGVWSRAVRDRTKPIKECMGKRAENNVMRRNFEHFKLVRGVLYREVKDDDRIKRQLVLPAIYVNQVLRGLHDEIGHPGRDRTISLVTDRFFWPGMRQDVENWVKECRRCICRKSGTNTRAPLVNISTTYPLELVCIDYLTLEPSKGGIENVLVVTDHFTRFAMAIPTKNQTAKTTTEAFYNNFILKYGIPTRLHSDQGANFESEIVKELCKLTGMEKSRTTCYHPMSNGMTERFNRTLMGMLGTLETEKKGEWTKHIGSLVYAYNATKHDSTGYSPFELMFGRQARLPLDMVFGTQIEEGTSDLTEYGKELHERLKTAYDKVNHNADQARSKQKAQFDKKARAGKLEIGDDVLVKILAHSGRHKLSDRYEEESYRVIKQPNKNIPVFVVRNENGVEKTLHRNHLLPLESRRQMENTKEEVQVRMDKPIPKPRKLRANGESSNTKSDVAKGENKHVEQTYLTERTQGDAQSSDDEEKIVHAVPINQTLIEDSTDSETESDPEEEENTEDSQEEESQEEESQEEEPVVEPAPRRSTREKRSPSWHKDYHVFRANHVANTDVMKRLICSGVLGGVNKGKVEQIVDAVFAVK